MSNYLPILILSIFADVVCNNSVIRVFEVQGHFNSLTPTLLMLLLQMVAAPVQAGFSDFYCRKKSLIIALSSSFLALVFLFFATAPGLLASVFLFVGLLINACLGNTVPISWSALADIQEKNLRFSFALTTSAYAIGYMFLAFLGKAVPQRITGVSWIWQDITMPLILLGVSVALIWKFYRDLRDRKIFPKLNHFSSHHLSETSKNLFEAFRKRMHQFAMLARSESSALAEEIRCTSTRSGLLAYFCWAVSQYSPLILFVNSQDYAFTVIIMMIGYLVGIAILGFLGNIRDEKIIKSAYVVTIFSMALFFVLNNKMNNGFFVLSSCCFLYTLGNAFLTASIFSLFSKEREFHEQGKGFGLIVSADSAGFFIGIIAATSFSYFKLDVQYMILLSSFVFLVSWFPYALYEKTRKDAARIKSQ